MWKLGKRQALLAAAVAVLAAAAVAAGPFFTDQGGHSKRTASTPPLVKTRFAVFVDSYARPRWAGLVLVDPAHRRCTNVPLPSSPSYITFSGDRYVYSTGPKSYRLGRVGGPPPRRFRTDTADLPYWLDVGLAWDSAHHLRLGGRTVNLDLPRGAQVARFVGSRGRIAFQAWWGDTRENTNRTAIFLYAHGVQRRVAFPVPPRFAANPTEYDLLGWTPDGRRLVVQVHGNLWTASPNGTHLRPLTHFAPTSSVYRGGNLLWSPDGRYIAFANGTNRPPETYVVRADGTRPVRRLTHTKWSSGPYGQQNGTMPLTWLSPTALAAAHRFSIGILGLDGSFRPLCKRDGVTFWNATALPGGTSGAASQPSR
jgi:WD40 repeat protein